MYFVFYQSAMVLSLVMSLFMGILSWRRRQLPGALMINALAILTFIWTLGFLLEANSGTLTQQLFFNNIGYLGSMSVPVAWFMFALQYTSVGKMNTTQRLIGLSIVPLVIIILVWTNSWNHLMWSNEHLINSGPFLVTAKTYGPFFWGALTYNYALIVAGSVLLVRRLFVGTPLYVGQAVSLLVAATLPLIWNVIYVFNLLPIPRKDLTPATFAVSGVAIGLGLIRFRLLAVVPFARKFIIGQLREGIFVFDTHGHLLEANPAALKLARARNDVIGRRLDYLSPLSPVFEHISSHKAGRVEFPLSIDGENRFYELETIPMRDNQNQQVGQIVTLHDITEPKKLQAQLMAQDRLASIGQLAAGIAHEINNPLTPVIGFADLLLKRDLPEDIKADIQIIYNGAKKTANVVERLLTFARQNEPVRTLCSMDEIVDSAIQLISHQLEKDNIRVIREYALRLPQTLADTIQLEQVFLNLIVNADYEMSKSHGSGTLTIKIEKLDKTIRVSVKDDGRGIQKENMDRLFTPFFTTKPVGDGTGLGLSICHGIVAEHGGTIYVESEEGKGATFIVELPVVTQLPPAIEGQQPSGSDLS